MNSGLYALAGASATATAAAWAKRLDPPITKVSKPYFGLRRESPREGDAGRPGLSVGAVMVGVSMYGCSAAGSGCWANASCAISGFTTMAKLLTPAASSSEPMALRRGTRIRCSSIPRVRSLGTSR
jgi:hypothetical protein